MLVIFARDSCARNVIGIDASAISEQTRAQVLEIARDTPLSSHSAGTFLGMMSSLRRTMPIQPTASRRTRRTKPSDCALAPMA